MSNPRAAAIVAAALFAAALPAQGGAQTVRAGSLIDVPYLAQPPELCGGAALAMVFRYWGDAHARAEEFAPIVDRRERGIRTDALEAAARDRGWQAYATRASADTADLDAQLGRGRPVIALIEDRPGAFHYVVVVARTDDAVVVHDPARAPFRVVALADFEARWSKSSRWMLLVLPSGSSSDATRTAKPAKTLDVGRDSTATTSGSCAAFVERSIDAAADGDFETADRGLTTATAVCPSSADAWRELAGLRLLQSRTSDARRLADHAVALAPDDSYAWKLLATARFMEGDETGALEAWNRAGEPRVDSVRVIGAERTRHPVIVDLVGLSAGDLLTSTRFTLASRRLRELPSAKSTTLRLAPEDNGFARVEAIVQEKRVFGTGLMDWVAIGARAVLKDEVKIDIAGPSGSGELWTGSWRWSANRPRVAFGLALPAPRLVRGVIEIDGAWERQTYAVGPTAVAADGFFRETRRRGGVLLSDWVTDRLHWKAGAALDHIGDARHLALDAVLDYRWLNDHVSTGLLLSEWMPIGGAQRFSLNDISIAWRTDRDAAPALSGLVGLTTASRSAPFAVWPAASTGGSGRGASLRAHPLHENGIITSDNFGRRLAYFSVEHQRPLKATSFGKISLAAFVDAARAWGTLPDRRARTHVDVGGGVRVGTGSMGLVRLDVGFGLRDQQWAISAGWVAPWPGR